MLGQSKVIKQIMNYLKTSISNITKETAEENNNIYI